MSTRRLPPRCQTASAGGASTGQPTNVGQGSGNSANGSLGTAQVGGGNSATDSIGTSQVGSGQPSGNPSGPPAETLSSGQATALPARSAAAATPSAAGSKAARSASPGTKSPNTLGAQHTTANGTLPFTGVDLLYAVIAGLVLIGAGLGLRRRVTA
jgi:hypothetical protein